MMELSIFHDKLNKVDGKVYVIEEEIQMPASGIYDAELQHDNIVDSTLAVYTGPTLTGEQIQTYALSTPSLMPWKRIIRIQTDKPIVYISYETEGDTVEAQDINIVQDAILATQGGVNAEESRAKSAEAELDRDLQAETDRATGEEQRLSIRIDVETGRAQDAENVLSVRLDAETVRAEAAEQENEDAIVAESSRAAAAEKVLTDSLGAETRRATEAEKALTDNLTAETTRATAAEKKNADEIKSETARAESAEASILGTINTNKPIWDDKYTRNEVDNKFSTLETAIDWKEAVNTFSDLSAVYPDPEDGWTINVKDTDYTYRWNGTEWIAISANAIPKATQSVDGLLSKEDKINYDDTYNKRHTHSNKGIIDKITQSLLDAWNAAYAHISDTVKHITGTERENWTDAYNKRHTHSNKGVIDKVTQAMLDKLSGIAEGANKYVHPTTSGNKHIPSGGASGQVLKWSTDGTAAWGAPETGYTHPNSGVTAGTYKSVNVNAQGHVTGGSNPNTLAGYGIMDAAAKNHNHDSVYLKKGAITWNDLGGG